MKRQRISPSNFPEKGSRKMMVKMIQNLRKTMKNMQEMFTKDIERLNRDEQCTRRIQ